MALHPKCHLLLSCLNQFTLQDARECHDAYISRRARRHVTSSANVKVEPGWEMTSPPTGIIAHTIDNHTTTRVDCPGGHSCSTATLHGGQLSRGLASVWWRHIIHTKNWEADPACERCIYIHVFVENHEVGSPRWSWEEFPQLAKNWDESIQWWKGQTTV